MLVSIVGFIAWHNLLNKQPNFDFDVEISTNQNNVLSIPIRHLETKKRQLIMKGSGIGDICNAINTITGTPRATDSTIQQS